MSKLIYLTKGKITVVDDDIFEKIKDFDWHLTGRGYAAGRMAHRKGSKWGKQNPVIKLHRYVMNAPDDKYVDHINGDKLDNRRSNLRLVSHSQNMLNAKVYKTSKSGVRGVSWFKRDKKWRAHIMVNYKQKHLGYFDTLEEATIARKEAEIKFGAVNERT